MRISWEGRTDRTSRTSRTQQAERAGLGRWVVATLLALTMTPGVRYTGWRWKYIARTRRLIDGRRCAGCRGRGVVLNVHHRRAVSRGGSHFQWNLKTLCQACHERAHGRDLDRDGGIG